MTQLTNTSKVAAAQLASGFVGAFTNSSILRIYSGTMPATPETAVSTQTLLASVVLPSSNAFTNTDGVLTAGTIADVSVAITGTATWCRWVKADGTTVIADATVGTTDANLILNAVDLGAGATLHVTSFTYTVSSV